VETDVEPDRVLTTILFTDIAASTERARALGDRLRHGISFPRERRHVRVVKRGRAPHPECARRGNDSARILSLVAAGLSNHDVAHRH
jgi:hypothetical protein